MFYTDKPKLILEIINHNYKANYFNKPIGKLIFGVLIPTYSISEIIDMKYSSKRVKQVVTNLQIITLHRILACTFTTRKLIKIYRCALSADYKNKALKIKRKKKEIYFFFA